MKKYQEKVRRSMACFDEVHFFQIPRDDNTRADKLAKLASSPTGELDPTIYIEHLSLPSIDRESIMEIDMMDCWINPIKAYLEKGILPEDKIEAKRIERKSSKFIVHEGKLLRKSITNTEIHPFLQCLRPEEAELALLEIHEGMCGNHVGPRSLVHKAVRQGFYWPTMLEDAKDLVRKCPKCQIFASFTHEAATNLVSIISPIPFAQWGIDLLSSFPVAKTGQFQFLVVAVDYFTKWIETEPLALVKAANIEKFVWKSIICRYGLPRAIIADNGPQFNCKSFKDFCEKWRINLKFASVAHPESNGQVESANKVILNALKRRIDGKRIPEQTRSQEFYGPIGRLIRQQQEKLLSALHMDPKQ